MLRLCKLVTLQFRPHFPGNGNGIKRWLGGTRAASKSRRRTIFEPCTSSVFARSAFCQLIWSYQWVGGKGSGPQWEAAEGKLVICMTPACWCV